MRYFAIFLRFLQILVILLFTSPLLMLAWWFFTPKTELALTVVDKTVLNREYEEHASLFWLLNHKKYAHPLTGKRFDPAQDYYGFFPKKLQQFDIKGLSQLSEAQLDSIVANSSHLYFTDTYGIYSLEWYKKDQATERSELIYGGLTKNDLYTLRQAKAAGKTIITEFNCIGSPTAQKERKDFEELFGLTWSGWIGRFVDNLDTLENLEIPYWMKRGYVQQHGHWPFKKAGIVLVSQNDRIEILEQDEELYFPVPVIHTRKAFQERIELPDTMPYPFWFDIMKAKTVQVEADYKLYTSAKGDSLLHQLGLSATFPAILSHDSSDYRFYYFAGDYADNPIQFKRSYFRGIRFFREFFYDPTEPTDRHYFFWEYYLPMIDYLLAR
ncbi:MAG: hypothetical protein C0424_07560 [Sphingobacteriaceae bacterium]|nr:hypothetical protein [Sphingobacteriaceae bacterium]